MTLLSCLTLRPSVEASRAHLPIYNQKYELYFECLLMYVSINVTEKSQFFTLMTFGEISRINRASPLWHTLHRVETKHALDIDQLNTLWKVAKLNML